MAARFPQVLFKGIDRGKSIHTIRPPDIQGNPSIVPFSAAPNLPSNVTLTLHDITNGIPFAPSSFNIVHACLISTSVRCLITAPA